MKILITGANGFLGKYVVSEALRMGHSVRALVRPAAKTVPLFWNEHPGIEIFRGDLRDKRSIASVSKEMDCVVHLAAAKSGDLYEQLGGTVVATENLLADIYESSVRKIIMISSFSVYEYMRRRSRSLLDENSPLAKFPFRRDEYCQTKLQQEKLLRKFVETCDCQAVILRPGVIFGRDNLWTARLGMQLSEKRWLATGSWARLPLTYVENCAKAIILSSELEAGEKIRLYNVVDDKLPVQKSYLRFLRNKLTPRPRVITIPWFLMRFIGRCVWMGDQLFFHGKAKIPGIVYPDKLHSRNKPLRYTNRKIKDSIGWFPDYSWKEGILRSLSEEDLITIK